MPPAETPIASAAALLGRRGGHARAATLTPEKLSSIGRKAGIASGKARKHAKRKSKQELAHALPHPADSGQ